MIDQPSIEADTEHDIVRKQRMPLSVEARKVALWDEVMAALEIAHRVNNEALPKFNWGASALDANAIGLLNCFGVVSTVFERARAIK